MNDCIGKEYLELDTPALWVDLDQMEANIRDLSTYLKAAGVNWRPHTKAMKVPAIAHKLLAAGAIGITCAKLSEAEVMAAAGIRDILIANQVVGPTKAARLANLRRQADVIVAVDNLDNAAQLSKAACDAGVTLRVVIEVNIGMNRAGLMPDEGIAEFAEKLGVLPGLKIAGVMGWEGHVFKLQDQAEKLRLGLAAVSSLVQTAEMLRAAGWDIQVVSCGGSGTYQIASHVPGVTEIQAGGAIFADVAYHQWGVPFDSSLFVLTTITSRPTPHRAIIDAGRKTLSSDAAMPLVRGHPGVELMALYAEHGILKLDSENNSLRVGNMLDLVVGYSDSTVFLHNRLVGVRNGIVESVWEIQGRGMLT